LRRLSDDQERSAGGDQSRPEITPVVIPGRAEGARLIVV
jgi:hypothetical protein